MNIIYLDSSASSKACYLCPGRGIACNYASDIFCCQPFVMPFSFNISIYMTCTASFQRKLQNILFKLVILTSDANLGLSFLRLHLTIFVFSARSSISVTTRTKSLNHNPPFVFGSAEG